MKANWIIVPAAAVLALSGCTSAGDGPVETAGESPPTSTSVESGTLRADTPTADTPTEAPPPSATPSNAAANEDLVDVKCTKDSDGSWSFEGALKNPSTSPKTYTVAIAVTVGTAVKGHALLTQEVQADSVQHVAAPDFAVANDAGAVCEPVTSVGG